METNSWEPETSGDEELSQKHWVTGRFRSSLTGRLEAGPTIFPSEEQNLLNLWCSAYPSTAIVI